MVTPINDANDRRIPEALEQTNNPNYVPYPRDGIRDQNSASQPTVGWPEPNKAEFLNNTEERCAVVLVLDKSASMAGARVQQLNEAIAEFKNNLMEDRTVARKIDIAVNEFNNLARYHPFENAESWQPPVIDPNGGTCLSFAINVALDAVTQRKDDYRRNGISYYRPWIVVLTDGYPEHDSSDELDAISERIRKAHDQRQCNLFVIACGEANESAMSLLRTKIAPPGRLPKKTNEANFRELFEWLSNSMTAVSRSSPTDQIHLADTSGWEIA